jgi:hypothetical protein
MTLHDRERRIQQPMFLRPTKYNAMEAIQTPMATATTTPIMPARPCRTAMPPKIGFVSSKTMDDAPRAVYFHSFSSGVM